MWAYWLLFLVPAGIAFSPIRFDKNVNYMLWAMVGLLGILLIGLRYKVGGDWLPYLSYFEQSQTGDMSTILIVGQGNASLYMFLNWAMAQLGLGIYAVNLVCGAIVMVGLVKYCKKQPMPWIALAVAMPYLVCCVAMGYTRQAAALGFLLWGLSILRKGNEHKFFGLILIGSLMHLSLLVTLPLMVLTRDKILWHYYLLSGPLVAGLYYLFSTIDVLQYYALIYEYTMTRESAGGAIRAYMNLLPVIVSFFFWDRIKRISPDFKIIKWMGIIAILAIPLLSFSTTMVDRFSLYLMPLQIALWPRLIAIQRTKLSRSVWASIITVYYGLILFVWFNFAVTRDEWVPYRMWPFTSEPIYPALLPMF